MNGLPAKKMSEDVPSVNPFIGTETKENNIPYGYCYCGCGEKTTIAKRSSSSRGVVKGQPMRFLPYHHLIGINNKGKDHPQWKGGESLCNGYYMVYMPNHPRSHQNRIFKSHLIVEKVLGNILPFTACIHHINGDSTNDANNNLLVCENNSYHILIHTRDRAYKACGNANYRKCPYCKKYDDINNMKGYNNQQYRHLECYNAYSRNLNAIRQAKGLKTR